MASVVLQTAFLGDMILTTPLLERLAAQGPVDVVATPASAPLLAGHPAVRHTLVYDKRGADAGWSGLRRMAARVRATGATTAYLAQGSLRTAAVARLAGIRARIGFDTSPGRVLYTARVPFDRTRHHAVRLLQLAGPVTSAALPRPTLYPGDADRAAVRALLARHGVIDDEPIVALAPGSVWATKRWPSYDELASTLMSARGATPGLRAARLVVLGGAADAPLAAAIAAAVQRIPGAMPAIDATGQLSMLGSAALLARASLLVTNDSAPLHLASAMNTPTIALFGPTVPAFGFGPLADSRALLGVDALPCRPCDAHGPMQCPLGHWKCMRELPADDVVREAMARLA